jgi:DNA-binding SARP family transcriptional activator
MALNERINAAYAALLEQLERANVLLLHPRSKYRSVLLAMLVNDDDVKTYYYALAPDDINLPAFIQSITHDLANQHPTFGRHLNMMPKEVFADMEKHVDVVLQNFVAELSELSDEPYMLIFDEYDRSDAADDIHRFVEHLADYLPANCRLIINSRTLPRLPWVSMVAKKQAALLLDDHLIEEDFYENKRDQAYDLEVFALGPGYVIHKGTEIHSWEGHLPRLLFFFTLDKPIVTRSEICNAFWPELQIDQAVNVFHVTKRRLHKALGFDVLVHNETHYQINPEMHVYYDVLDFVETLMKGRNPNNPNPFEAWQHAAKLYRGPFLQGHNDPWIEERRVAFRAGYLEALTQMAQAWIGKDRKELALKLYRQALDEDNSREDIHREIMKLYKDLGRRSEAVKHYQDLEKSFADSGKKISAQTVEVYNEIVS